MAYPMPYFKKHTIDFSTPYRDPTPAKVLFETKLRLKINRMIPALGIGECDKDCVTIISDYAEIYIKSVLRAMAKQKQRHKTTCPLTSDGSKTTVVFISSEEESSEDEFSEAKVRELRKNLEATQRHGNFYEEWEAEDSHESSSSSVSFDRRSWFEGLLKRERDKVASDPKGKNYTSSNDKGIKKTDKKRSSGKKHQKRSPKEIPNEETVTSEVVYTPVKYNVKDFVRLLENDACVIPLQSVYALTMRDSRARFDPDPTC